MLSQKLGAVSYEQLGPHLVPRWGLSKNADCCVSPTATSTVQEKTYSKVSQSLALLIPALQIQIIRWILVCVCFFIDIFILKCAICGYQTENTVVQF
jgi:hypothetical protein